MKPRLTLLCSIATFLFFTASSVHAFCPLRLELTVNGQPVDYELPLFINWDTVPVYLVTEGIWAVDNAGFSLSEAEVALRGAIYEWNTIPGAAVRIHYAGEVSSREHSAATEGITVYGGSTCGGSANTLGAHTITIDKMTLDYRTLELKALTFSSPSEICIAQRRPDLDSSELQEILTHEIGHAYGLIHTDDMCTESQGGRTRGVMYSSVDLTANLGINQTLRRDDIEGTRLLYGTKPRTVEYANAASSTDFWGRLFRPGRLRTHSRVSATDTTSGSDHRMTLAYSDERDRVSATHGGLWMDWSQGRVVQPGPYGYVFSAPSAARGAGQTLVAWTYEWQTSWDTVVVYNTRPDDGAWQTSVLGETTPHNRVTVGWDEYEGQFLLAYLDSTNRNLVTVHVSPDWGIPSNRIVYEERIGELGNPLMWRLVPAIPHTTDENFGCVDWAALAFGGVWNLWISSCEVTDSEISALSDPIRGDIHLSLNQYDGWNWFYRIPRGANLSNVVQGHKILNGGWPVELGAFSFADRWFVTHGFITSVP